MGFATIIFLSDHNKIFVFVFINIFGKTSNKPTGQPFNKPLYLALSTQQKLADYVQNLFVFGKVMLRLFCAWVWYKQQKVQRDFTEGRSPREKF